MDTPGRVLHPLLRNLPNAISLARLAATPVLFALIVTGHREPFKWLLLACLLSDIADGLLARSLHITSKLGSALDSVADMITLLAAMVGIAVFEGAFVQAHRGAIAAVIILYLAEAGASLLRYGKLSSFHTLLDRVAAYAGGIFIMALFLWGYQGWILYLAVAAYVVSLAEEFVLIMLLPTWQSDVGGLRRVLRNREAK